MNHWWAYIFLKMFCTNIQWFHPRKMTLLSYLYPLYTPDGVICIQAQQPLRASWRKKGIQNTEAKALFNYLQMFCQNVTQITDCWSVVWHISSLWHHACICNSALTSDQGDICSPSWCLFTGLLHHQPAEEAEETSRSFRQWHTHTHTHTC